jgi:hypothetical protein
LPEVLVSTLAEPADRMSPDKAYERQWAMSLLARVLAEAVDDELWHLFAALS